MLLFVLARFLDTVYPKFRKGIGILVTISNGRLSWRNDAN